MTGASRWVARALLVTAILGAALLLEVPTVQLIPDWFWPLRDTPGLAPLPLLAAGAVMALLLPALADPRHEASRRRLWAASVAMFALGVGFQLAVANATHRRHGAVYERLVQSGHGEFAVAASRGHGTREVVSRYDDLVRREGLRYARTKPPGQLLLFEALTGLADAVLPAAAPGRLPSWAANGRHHRFVRFASVALPVLSCLALFPLVLLARALLPRGRALPAAALYLLCPPTALVVAHLDQAVYPLLALGLWAAVVPAVRSRGLRGHASAAAAGLAAWGALFVSFSLLPAIAVAAVVAFAASARPTVRARLGDVLRASATAAAVFGALTAAAARALGYDLLARFRDAMAFHAAWRPWGRGAAGLLACAALDLVEFVYWLGLPVAALFAHRVAWALVEARGRRLPDAAGVVAGGTALVLLATALLGRTRGEVARLWIFLIPAVALAVAAALAVEPRERARACLRVMAAAQVAWTLLLKARQDFY